jgi:CBS domain-containing protein
MKVIRELIGDRTPYSVSPDMTVQSVVEYLCDRRVGAVAVCDGDNKAVGVFSERDLLHRVVLPELDTQKVLISEVMTADVVHVNIDDKHSTARNLMLGKNFRHLVVLDDDENYKGFVSIRELIEVDLQESQELVHKLNDDYYEEQFKPDK